MIKNLIISVICVVFFSTAFDMIFPDGSLKKYFKLVMGFILIRVIIMPFTGDFEAPQFDFQFDKTYTEEELNAISDAYILKLHEDNITNYIKEICGEENDVFVELFSDGIIRSIVIEGNVDNKTIEYLKDELGCENINTVEGYNEY